MDARYEDARVKEIFGDGHKLGLWQKTELAAVQALEERGRAPRGTAEKIGKILLAQPINLDWWRARDKEIYHDLNAFLDERLRYLPPELQEFFHKKLTSFDTQEPAFARMLLDSLEVLDGCVTPLGEELMRLARKYRYTPMNARTHGQEAELQTFGARILTWLKDLRIAHDNLAVARKNLRFSKLSGAIGKYGSIDPAVEKRALKILGFEPYYGATQIMPRIIYVPLAQALANLVLQIDKIAVDIRLNARSGQPLLREPFTKKQKGSSAMPHKKNPVRLEQLEGMGRMAEGYCLMIQANIRTWEERAIEQSSVERVAWPDLFHITVHSVKVITKALSGLKVYSEAMLREIHESRGVYASSEVKEFLKERLTPMGLTHEDAYRIVQLACFNVFEPPAYLLAIRNNPPISFRDAGNQLAAVAYREPDVPQSIQTLIPAAQLKVCADLDITAEQIAAYNQALERIFEGAAAHISWNKLFEFDFLLQGEAVLYREILGE